MEPRICRDCGKSTTRYRKHQESPNAHRAMEEMVVVNTIITCDSCVALRDRFHGELIGGPVQRLNALLERQTAAGLSTRNEAVQLLFDAGLAAFESGLRTAREGGDKVLVISRTAE